MSIFHRIFLLTFALSAAAGAAQPPVESPKTPPVPAAPSPPPSPPPSSPPATPPATPKELTAQERLAATAKLYNEAKNYRDEGTLTSEMSVMGRKITDTKPFTTAFARGGRFRWEFRDSAMPGQKPDQRYAIWSADGDVFKSYWTATRQLEKHDGIDMPLAGATGISGGAATAIIPLLHIGKKENAWGIMSTDLVNPADKGKEAVDGVDCWKIEGTGTVGEVKSTLWIDGAGLIRKIYTETVIDSSKFPKDAMKNVPEIPKFTSYTTITLKPFVNEPKIDDAKFAVNEKDGSQPAK